MPSLFLVEFSVDCHSVMVGSEKGLAQSETQKKQLVGLLLNIPKVTRIKLSMALWSKNKFGFTES